VPTSESGTATLGMMVAARFRRNRKITITTSPMVSINSNSTSFTDARIVVVRSVRICTFTAAGSDCLQLRQQFLDAVHHADDVRARLALDVHDDGRRRSSRPPAACSRAVDDVATSESRTGAPLR
jgi:hypothetical protein